MSNWSSACSGGRSPKHSTRGARAAKTSGEELADVAIYLLSLAEMTGIDLQDEIEAKQTLPFGDRLRALPTGALWNSEP